MPFESKSVRGMAGALRSASMNINQPARAAMFICGPQRIRPTAWPHRNCNAKTETLSKSASSQRDFGPDGQARDVPRGNIALSETVLSREDGSLERPALRHLKEQSVGIMTARGTRSVRYDGEPLLEIRDSVGCHVLADPVRVESDRRLGRRHVASK